MSDLNTLFLNQVSKQTARINILQVELLQLQIVADEGLDGPAIALAMADRFVDVPS